MKRRHMWLALWAGAKVLEALVGELVAWLKRKADAA